MRERKKVNDGGRPVANVALVMITVGTRSNSCSRNSGPMSIGAADRVMRGRCRLLAATSTQ